MSTLHAAPVWFLVGAFAAAGLINLLGTSAGKASFVRWGYPSWWCYVTGGLELLVAVLVALPAGRQAGSVCGAVIVSAAALTVARRREFSHLAPLGIFAVLTAVVFVSS